MPAVWLLLGVIAAPGLCSATPRGASDSANDSSCSHASVCRRKASPASSLHEGRSSAEVILQWKLTSAFLSAAVEDADQARSPDDAGHAIPRIASEARLPDDAAAKPAPAQDGDESLGCFEPVDAMAVSPTQNCPERCPFWAHDLSGANSSGKYSGCAFQCVRSQDCGKLDASAAVSDPKGMYCRQCRVEGCNECFGRGVDRCRHCRAGFLLTDGQCLSSYRTIWVCFYTLALLILALFLAWYVDLSLKPIVNEAGLRQGLNFRWRTRLHRMTRGEENDRINLLPLSTNLLHFGDAGPSLPLFFRYQLFVILWALTIAGGWVLVALFTDTSLLVVGLRHAPTPRMVCYIISWGHRMQQSLQGVKENFLMAVYLGTFACTLLHAVLQLRSFEALDREATMKDYAALCSGVPEEWTGEEAELRLKERVEQSCGVRPIGVSICWDFTRQHDEVMDHINRITEQAQRRCSSFEWFGSNVNFLHRLGQINNGEEEKACILLWPLLFIFERINRALGFGNREVEDDEDSSSEETPEVTESESAKRPGPEERMEPEDEVLVLLQSLKHCGQAYVVFETQTARDQAVTDCQSASGLSLEQVDVEPDAVNWRNYHVTQRQAVMRLGVAILVVLAGLIIWISCFYFPYAYYQISYSLAVGEPPGTFSRLTFATLVIMGNQFMYILCSRVARACCFKHIETEQMTYIILYLAACVVNVCLDMTVTYATTYFTLVSTVRTFDGRRLETLSHMELLDSYPMQRNLGGLLFKYAFPSCFLLPFLLEPLVTVVLPAHISELLVRSHPNIVGFAAERALAYKNRFDFARYADISLNMIISAFMLFFPGGYILPTFGVVALCHTYIYFLDHWKVLRALPGFKLASNVVDRTASAMLAIPTGIIAAAAIVKARMTLHDILPAATGSRAQAATIGFFIHVAVHWFLLYFMVPLFTPLKKPSDKSYRELSRDAPCSWFSANPVHCLRSRHIHGDSPPWCYYVRGKEYLMFANPKIGNFYEPPENYRGQSQRRLKKTSPDEPANEAREDWPDGARKASKSAKSGKAVVTISSIVDSD